MKLRHLILSACILSTQVNADTAKGIWTNYQGDAAHTGYLDVHADPAKLKVVWTRTFDNHEDRYGKFTYPAVVTDHMLYFATSDSVNTNGLNGIYALNKYTGETVWHKPITNDGYLSGPVYSKGKIYLTEFTGHSHTNETGGAIKSYDAETGALQYSQPLTLRFYDTYTMPVIFGDHVYLGKYGKQYSLLAETGKVEWLTEGGDSNQNLAITNDYIIRTEPTGIVLLNRQNGGDKMTITGMEQSDHMNRGAPVWDERRKTVYAVLTPELESQPGGWITTQLTAFDTEQKLVKWKLIMPAVMQPALVDDKLYFSSDSNVYEVNAVTGKINWSWSSPSGALDLVVTRDLIFVESYYDQKTYAISRSTHEKVWEININGHMSLDEDHLYLVNGYSPSTTVTAIALH